MPLFLLTRWADGQTFPLSTSLSVCHGVSSALAYLHSLGIAHGDVYAHNIMLDDHCHPVICDFGASYCYDEAASGRFWQAMEVRAYGLFMHDIVTLTDVSDGCGGSDGSAAGVKQLLLQLVQGCLAANAMERPLFCDVEGQLLEIMQQLNVAVPSAEPQQ